ncbi:hypothetical protein TRFO_21288 [Tritrichomonas foetus]|uniref:VPS9 domain-containing protein n=1 Tax=Tritrichomonas foetus TaxID=1144522 RepID=A0A1J4KE30_9EUKA|nr:hypothetical protein TRFO_21288 [Tritrichomonas foetus]|eukprot:OHT09681.1 hypothetical protein TRFO_21288 [Tritrichomonas foetus]
MSVTPTQRLFNLHLQIKKSIVNNQRNIEEVKRLRLTFEKQIRDLIVSLYQSSKAIYQFRYNPVDSINKEQVASGEEVATVDASNIVQRVMHYVEQSQGKLREIISKSVAANQNHLSHGAFQLILTTFHYLWSQEQISAFSNFIKRLDPSLREHVYVCFLVQPLTQIYFENCLQPVFAQIQGKSTSELQEILIQKMQEYAPLFPEYLREIFVEAGSQNNSQIFWKSFLRPFLTLSSLFGLTHPEFSLYCEVQYNQLLESLDNYFASPESNEIIHKIVTCQESLSLLPSEALLTQVDPMYNTSTLIDATAVFEATESFVEKPNISAKVSYITVAKPSGSSSNAKVTELTLNDRIKNFLSLTRLVKLETEQKTIADYLRQLADFSSTDGDGDIERALDSLVSALPPETTLDQLCQSLEEQLNSETANDTLLCLSEYSSQNLYLSKLKDVIESISKNSLNYIEFTKTHKMLKTIFEDPQTPPPSADSVMKSPKLFVDYVSKCCDSMMNLDPSMKPSFLSYRNICSIILHDLGILKMYSEREDLKKLDETVHSFMSDEADNLLAFHQLSFLDIYREDRTRLKMFFEEFEIAFKCQQPFEKISHIHSAYQVLTGLLTLQGIGEIGADQIVPFAMVATVYSNPVGLASTSDFLSNYISPLLSIVSPLDHAEEYSVIQFLSTFQFVTDKIKEKGIQFDFDAPNM